MPATEQVIWQSIVTPAMVAFAINRRLDGDEGGMLKLLNLVQQGAGFGERLKFQQHFEGLYQTALQRRQREQADAARASQEAERLQGIEARPESLFSESEINTIVQASLAGNFTPMKVALQRIQSAGGSENAERKFQDFIQARVQEIQQAHQAALRRKEDEDRRLAAQIQERERQRRLTELEKEFEQWVENNVRGFVRNKDGEGFRSRVRAWMEDGIGQDKIDWALDLYNNLIAGATPRERDAPIDPAPDPPEPTDLTGNAGVVWYPGLSQVASIEHVMVTAEALARGDDNPFLHRFLAIQDAHGTSAAFLFRIAVWREASALGYKGAAPAVAEPAIPDLVWTAGIVAVLRLLAG